MSVKIERVNLYKLELTADEFKVLAAAVARTSPKNVIDVLQNAGDDSLSTKDLDEIKADLTSIFEIAMEDFGWYR